MTTEEFFRKYANVPINDRLIPIIVKKDGATYDTNLNHLFRQIKGINDLLRPHEIRREELLSMAESHLNNIEDIDNV